MAHLLAAGASQNAIVERLAGAPVGIAASNRIYEEKLADAAQLEARRNDERRGSPR